MTSPARIGPDTVIGDFKVVRPLAKGAMGAVYVAEQISTGVERAIKVMHPQLLQDAKAVERFKQEARLCARLNTDHVVKILGAGADAPGGSPWIAMELLKGKDLGTIARERGAMPAREVREIFQQLCSGLGVAHANAIVHRDLKLENIFVADAQRSDVPFTVKILDFGISKVVQEFDAAQTAAIGSPMWMAPEQAKKGQVTPATDVWPLGLIAFRLLTGRVYWRSAANERPPVREVLMEVIVAPLEPASVRAQAFGVEALLPAGFDAWFARCVARDPTARFADANEALAALLPVLDGDGAARVSVPPVSTPAPAPTFAPAAPAPAPLQAAPANASLPGTPAYPPPANHGAAPMVAVPAAAPTPTTTTRAGGSRTMVYTAVAVATLLVGLGVLWFFGSAAHSAPLTHIPSVRRARAERTLDSAAHVDDPMTTGVRDPRAPRPQRTVLDGE